MSEYLRTFEQITQRVPLVGRVIGTAIQYTETGKELVERRVATEELEMALEASDAVHIDGILSEKTLGYQRELVARYMAKSVVNKLILGDSSATESARLLKMVMSDMPEGIGLGALGLGFDAEESLRILLKEIDVEQDT